MRAVISADRAPTAALVPLSQAAGQHSEVGSKAANLGTLMAAGFPVPDGVVLRAEALGRVLGADRSEGAIPTAISEWVEEALERLGPGPLAVRSSGLAEDLAEASYAGQYETVLGVEGLRAVADAIRRCWDSGSAARVAAYERASANREANGMAVLIQRLVPAEAAGVAFTANPVSGARDETLVSAVRGLGDGLVSGAVTPDEWVVRQDAAECRSRAGGAIDGATALSVAALARRTEAVFGTPQDVEWALAGGELYVLQARPITALPVTPHPVTPVPIRLDVPAGFWEREASHFPLPLSPMTRSLQLARQNDALAHAFAEHGFLADGLEFREIGGWVFVRMVPPGGKERPLPPAPLMWVLLRIDPALRSRIAAARRAARDDLSGRIIQAWHREMRPGLEHRITQLRDVDLASLDDRALLGHWERVRSLLDDGVLAHFRLHVPIQVARFELAQTCRELLGWDERRTFELLGGLSTMSTAPAIELATLLELAAKRPTTRQLVERADREAVALLSNEDPEFAAALEEYQRTYGTRAVRYEVADPTLREIPELTLATLRDQLRTGYDGRRQAMAMAARRSAAVATARQQLADRSEAERERFERALGRAEAAHPIHEENEFYTVSSPLALLRHALLEFGRRLAERGLFAAAEDVFFLEHEEMTTAFTNPAGDLRELVRRRRGEHAWALAHPPPASYGRRREPPSAELLPSEPRLLMNAMLWALEMLFAAERSTQAQTLEQGMVRGLGASPGRYTGTVRVILSEDQFDRIEAGDVLVCPVTSPVWSVLFSRIGALVTDTGGILSHPAIIAREYGIPAVVATGNATAILHDGQRVTVDGDAGIVEVQQG